MSSVVEEVRDGHPAVLWHGLTEDFAGFDQRWDLLPTSASTGTIVALTGRSDHRRASMLMRTLIGRDVWLVPGYAASWKLVWLHSVLAAD